MDSYTDKMGAGNSGQDETPGASDMPKDGDKQTVMLSADHFPPDMQPKDGMKLTFCVTGDPDSEGNVTGYFEGGDAPDASWEKDFRQAMSPRSEGEEAQ